MINPSIELIAQAIEDKYGIEVSRQQLQESIIQLGIKEYCRITQFHSIPSANPTPEDTIAMIKQMRSRHYKYPVIANFLNQHSYPSKRKAAIQWTASLVKYYHDVESNRQEEPLSITIQNYEWLTQEFPPSSYENSLKALKKLGETSLSYSRMAQILNNYNYPTQQKNGQWRGHTCNNRLKILVGD